MKRDEQGAADLLALLELVHKPLEKPQYNPCKTCGRTSIFPVCGMCQSIAELRRDAEMIVLNRGRGIEFGE